MQCNSTCQCASIKVSNNKSLDEDGGSSFNCHILGALIRNSAGTIMTQG